MDENTSEQEIRNAIYDQLRDELQNGGPVERLCDEFDLDRPTLLGHIERILGID